MTSHLTAVSGLAALTITLTAGCATLAPDIRPDVSLVEVQIANLDLLETEALLTLRITNEGLDPFPLEGAVFKLDLGGVKIGRGLLGEPVTVPKLDTTTVTVPVYISHLALATTIGPLLDSQRLDYRVRATFYTRGSLGTRSIKAEREGSLDLSNAADGTTRWVVSSP